MNDKSWSSAYDEISSPNSWKVRTANRKIDIRIQPEDVVPLAWDIAVFWVLSRKLRKRGSRILTRIIFESK